MKGYLLGIDNGLTATKAVVYDLMGSELGVYSSTTPVVNKRSGFSEIDPHQQWQKVCIVVKGVIEKTGVSPKDILGVGVSGYGNGLYLLDSDKKPFKKAITSMDHRAAGMVDAVDMEVEEELKKLTLQGVWDAQPGILLKWFKENELSDYKEINTVFFCKDWIRYCLTGQIKTEYSDISASGLLNNRTRVYDKNILELLDIPEIKDKMPEVISSYDVAGYITKQAAKETMLKHGTPVVSGLFDVTANSIGSGLVSQKQFCSIAGTWNINIALSKSCIIPERIRQCTVYADDNFYSYIDSSATSSSNLEWFMQNVLSGGCSYDDFERIIAQYGPDDVEIMFMPFIYSGLKNDNPGAVFYGLKSFHGKDDMLRAVAEGIGFAHYYHIKNLVQEGIGGNTVLLTGGASKNKKWCQLMADIMQMKIEVPESDQTGALGVCIMAGVGTGVFGDIRSAVKNMVKIKQVYEPDPDNKDVYQKKYKRFLELLKSQDNIIN